MNIGEEMGTKANRAQDFRVAFNAMAASALITPAEFAELLVVSENAFYQRRAKGELPQPAIVQNRYLRWRAGDVREWLEALRPTGAEALRRGRPRIVTDEPSRGA